MRKALIGTAAVAIAAMTAAYSAPVDAQGRGNGQGNGKEQAQQRGGGQKVDRGNSQGKQSDRGNAGSEMAERGPARDVRGQGRGNGNAGNRSAESRVERQVEREVGRQVDARAVRGNDRREQRTVDRRTADRNTYRAGRDRDYYRGDDRYRGDDAPFFARYDRDGNPGLVDGCPPGLAKKRNGCMPPGQARQADRDYDRPDWYGYSRLGNDYRYRDGYLVRYGDGGIASYLPLLGGALAVGNQFPSEFGVRQVPDYYRSYYDLGDDYRYYDNTLYRVDPQTAAITSIAALITGDDITVGQPMPAGYDVYNVPRGYRDRYYDRPDANYRYSDGYVYQVDPATRLVTAAIELLV